MKKLRLIGWAIVLLVVFIYWLAFVSWRDAKDYQQAEDEG